MPNGSSRAGAPGRGTRAAAREHQVIRTHTGSPGRSVSGELAFQLEPHAVIGRRTPQPNCRGIEHLREGERDHDEVDAARATEMAPITSATTPRRGWPRPTAASRCNCRRKRECLPSSRRRRDRRHGRRTPPAVARINLRLGPRWRRSSRGAQVDVIGCPSSIASGGNREQQQYAGGEISVRARISRSSPNSPSGRTASTNAMSR